MFDSDGNFFTTIYVESRTTNYIISYDTDDDSTTVYDATGGGWISDNYKTITLSTPQAVSAEFYEWAITGGNLVKQNTDLITITGAKILTQLQY